METEGRIDYRKASDETLYTMRKMVIKLWKSMTRRDKIEDLTGFSGHTISNIITTYKKQGMAGLKPKKRGRKKGTKCKLTHDKEHKIVATMVDHDPAHLKLKCYMWTRKTVHDYILREFGKDLPIRTLGEYPRRWGFTVQRPAKRAIKQSDQAVQAWLNEECPAIREKAKQEKAEIFWGDETAVQNEANYARGYALKGYTPILKIQTVKMHINMVSAISNPGKLHFLLYSDAMNADRMIHFMEALIKDIQHKVFFIIDNLKVHHSKRGKDWVEAHEDKISLFFLPPYSPEYNPDEYLNHDLKQTVGSREQAVTLSDIEEKTQRFMENLKADEKHVQSYFGHSMVKRYKLFILTPECFFVDPSTVYRLVKQEKTTGDFRTHPSRRGRKPLLSPEQKRQIAELVDHQPDITLSEIIEELHLSVLNETVRRALCNMGYTFKKKSLYTTEKERPRCAEQEKSMEHRYC